MNSQCFCMVGIRVEMDDLLAKIVKPMSLHTVTSLVLRGFFFVLCTLLSFKAPHSLFLVKTYESPSEDFNI